MPPGSPNQSQRKGLPTWAIVLLVIGGLMAAALATCVAIGGAAVYWAQDQAEGWAAAIEEGEAAGSSFGQGKTDNDCAGEYLRRMAACNDELDITCMQSGNGFAMGCWMTTGTPAGLCEGVGDLSDFTALSERQSRVCSHYAVQAETDCALLNNAVNLYCGSVDHVGAPAASPVPEAAPQQAVEPAAVKPQ